MPMPAVHVLQPKICFIVIYSSNLISYLIYKMSQKDILTLNLFGFLVVMWEDVLGMYEGKGV